MASGEVAAPAAATGQERTKGYIFSQLVEGRGDFTGYIAYALYKFEKIEHIRKYKRKHHHDIPPEEKNRFYEICCNNERIKGYRQRAAQMFDEFYSTLYEDIHAQAKSEVLENQKKHLLEFFETKDAEIEEKVVRLIKRYHYGRVTTFVIGILQGIVIAIVVPFVVWGIVHVVGRYKPEMLPPIVHRALFEDTTTQQPATHPSSTVPTEVKSEVSPSQPE